jgi:hypothetical protein
VDVSASIQESGALCITPRYSRPREAGHSLGGRAFGGVRDRDPALKCSEGYSFISVNTAGVDAGLFEVQDDDCQAVLRNKKDSDCVEAHYHGKCI